MLPENPRLGTIVILNGAPRSGKSSLAEAIQTRLEGVWIRLGVDQVMASMPVFLHPGIGLRPGGERPDLEHLVAAQYRALYASIAAHSREGLDVVADVGHHDDYSQPLGILQEAAAHLEGLPAYLIGVRCPVDVIVRRRVATGWVVAAEEDGSPSEAVLRWERAVHTPGIYDLEIDTSRVNPDHAADCVGARLRSSPAAWARIRAGA